MQLTNTCNIYMSICMCMNEVNLQRVFLLWLKSHPHENCESNSRKTLETLCVLETVAKQNFQTTGMEVNQKKYDKRLTFCSKYR